MSVQVLLALRGYEHPFSKGRVMTPCDYNQVYLFAKQ